MSATAVAGRSTSAATVSGRNAMVEGSVQAAATVDPSWGQPPANDSSAVLTGLVQEITTGKPWASALVEAIGRWSLPCETVDGAELKYLLSGEAFDWLLLAERLLRGVEAASPGLVPTSEAERLLVTGVLPADVSPEYFREALGFDKYRAYLNFFYGVVVEEALWQAVESEVQKERSVRGLHHPNGVLDLVCERLYRADLKTMLRRFRKERGQRLGAKFSLTEWKEFTYSLFKHRVGHHDSARIASDTRKGLVMLEELWGVGPEITRMGLLWGENDRD